MTAVSSGLGVSCPRCGAGVGADARFCAGCGADLALGQRIPPPPPTPAPVPPPSTRPSPVAVPAVEPSSVGRRASPLGWVGVVAVAGVFLVASIGVLAVASRPGGAGPGTGSGAPLARWDRTLYDGTTVTAGTPFEIEVEAVNPASAATDPLWISISWTPDDLEATPGARGRFVSAQPAGASFREDRAANLTVVSWPGLAPGERHVYRVTVVATGLRPGTTFRYRVRTGNGPDEPSIEGGYTWDLELEVE